MKKVLYIIGIIFILFMCWEYQKEDMVIANQNEVIPEESIRLRIIANSDLPEDQWIKREVRDVVVSEINKWIGEINNVEEARIIVSDHLEDLNRVITKKVEEEGFPYADKIKVELGSFPFPTKMYGQAVYPAGDYEALRITLGEGQGQNWWCVLFPPLCFVDMNQAIASENLDTENKIEVQNKDKEDVEVKFFIVEIFEKFFG